ncbi:dihydropteroate synthase [Acidithiobacillus sp. 'AMD consortium']|uniref:Dihydropteroate synthase n=2 Tax=Acidithiobacillus ferridurans TaxID=1232575 RepID=A0A8X8K8E4_ACIFI|nr:dihydropteroate synthase [Acidithiobacillus ferridurans]QFG79310.1 dihydropteroate synthase [Acidithiobacillus sp. 'AMD consortium']MBU2722286.1 dihydropteroate synthase [Acidithiobacillus ferridurans]MBU2726553.1 dihydropteroate synthase [Acidithiobacillus ferridurans]MBU2805709.1 dihydropteroate synthase [Acidithiobacillus ferridurans]
MTLTLDCNGRPLVLGRPCVMGVLNITPDSFSDGGTYLSVDAALGRAQRMWEEGADIIDIGAESTRPGAPAVTQEEELRRLLPVLEAVAAEVPLPISIDTSKAAVMRAAWSLGAGLMNDVTALRTDPLALETIAGLGIPVCLMHMRGTPQNMQENTRYRDVVAEVKDFLFERVAQCVAAGIPRHHLLVDPGFGFAKDLQANRTLLRHLDDLASLEAPLLVGLSRKRMIGELSGVESASERVAGSVAAALWAVSRGASIVRVHDVAETVQALRVWRGLA